MGTVTSVGSGNWEAGATWDRGSRAGNADDVIIASGHNVTVVQGEQANSLTVASGGTLTVTGSRTITIDSENDPSVGAYAVNLDGAIAHTDGSSNTSLTITTPATTNVDIEASSGNVHNLTINHASCTAKLPTAPAAVPERAVLPGEPSAKS